MASAFMPDVKVEIAWTSGYSTPAASRTWTDISDYVELDAGLTITWGRADERSIADANQFSMTLDNSDGRFTAGKTSGAYYPNVKLDRPVRVTATPVDGPAQVLFVGYINEWPTNWATGTDNYACAVVTASSRLARLGLTMPLRSIVEEVFLADSPVAYYPMGEPAGASAAVDTSGIAAPPLTFVGDPTLPVVFGDALGPPTDGLTAAKFQSGQYLSGPTSGAATGVTLECFVSLAPGTVGGDPVFIALPSTAAVSIAFVGPTGPVLFAVPGGSGSIIGNIADNGVHHIALTWDGVTLKGYVDGIGGLSTAVAGTPSIAGALNVGDEITCTVSHVAVYASALSAARILAHAQAGLTGFAGEATDVRLIRYAALAGVAATEVTAQAGSTTMAHVDTSDQQVVNMLRLVETTEGGVLFDYLDGTLGFHSRSHRYVPASAFSLDMGAQVVEIGYVPKLDRTGLLNDVTVTDVTGAYSARATVAASVADYGLAGQSYQTGSDDDDAPLQMASWLTFAYQTPFERAPSLSVNAVLQVGKTPNSAAVLAAFIGTKITLISRPSQAASSSATYFIEGGSYVFTRESALITWNVSPTSPLDRVLILGDAIRGVIGTNPLAY